MAQSFAQAHAQLYGGQADKAPNTTPQATGGGLTLFQSAHQTLIQQNQSKPSQPSPIVRATPQPQVQPVKQQNPIISGIRNGLATIGKKVLNAELKIPEVHFADTINQYTPKGFAGHATAFVAEVAQGLANSIQEGARGTQSQIQHIQQHNSTPQQVAGDAAATISPLLMLWTGGDAAVAKEGLVQSVKTIGKQTLAQAVKQAVKSTAKEGVTGATFGMLSGLQSGKNIKNQDDYLKNMLENIGIGAATGGGIGAVSHVVIPLVKGASAKLGAVFVKNVDKKPVVDHINVDPQVAQSIVVGNEQMARTPQGKKILKVAAEARQADAHVAIVPKQDGKIDVMVTKPYEPKGQAEGEALTKEPLKTTGIGGTDSPLASRAETTPSLTDTAMSSPSKRYVPGTTAGEVLSDRGFISHYNHITNKKATLDTILKKAADGRETISGVKEAQTAAEKIAGKIKKYPEFNETHINDLVRGTIVATDNADKATVLENLKKHADVTHVDDHSEKGNAWGYEGVNVTVKTPDGHLNEVQIHTKESLHVQKATHTLYEKWRREKDIPESVFQESKKIAEKARQEFRAKQDINRVITEDKPTVREFDKTGKEVVAPTKGKPLTGKQVEQIREVVRARLDVARSKAKSPQDFAKHVDAVVKDVTEKAGNDKMVLSALRTEINKEWEAIGGGGNYLEQARTIHAIREGDSDMAHLIDNLDDHKRALDEKLLTAQKPERGVAEAPAKLERAKQGGTPTVTEPVGTGSPKQSRAYKRLVAHLEQADPELFDKVKDDPKLLYNTVNQKYDFENAAKIVQTDPDKAYRIAKQMETAPVGQRWESVNIVLADRALAEKNIPLWKDLEQSRSFAQTRAGQGIVAEKGRFDDTSPHTYVQQVLDARLKKLGGNPITNGIDMTMKMLGKTTTSAKERAIVKIDRAVQRAKEFTKQERSKIEFAQNLLDQLTCK